jgi:hypothetical protein
MGGNAGTGPPTRGSPPPFAFGESTYVLSRFSAPFATIDKLRSQNKNNA